MNCPQARDAISARLDGAAPSPAAAAHLETCAPCRAWEAQATALVRSTLHQAPAMRSPVIGELLPTGFARNRWLRIALAWAGVLLVAWNLPGVITGGEDAAMTHLFRHQSAFSAALGLTFLIVAWHPDRAYGLVPFAAAFTVALAVTAVIDLIGGSSDAGPEARHVVEIGGLAVLWILGAGAGPRRRRKRVDPADPSWHFRASRGLSGDG